MKKLNIPVGISDFEKIRNGGFYYIDKSGLITEILDEKAEVTLITRPRRFGKTLGMSMLESFFDIRKDSKELFDGLEIAEHQVLCDEWMNQYPTVFISFRQVDGLDFTGAYDMLTMVIADLYNKHLYLLDSKSATEFQKTAFEHLAHGNGSIKEVKSSLMLLTTMMQSYYAKPVILLIDEYDVPVAKANNNGYYNEMLDVMKGLMQALKDNQALQFAVVTGCLKIAKESIFTGTNNFVSDTITNSRLNEYFGFVQSEVDLLCAALPAAALAEENTASIQTQVSETDEDIPWADPPQSTPETGRPDPAVPTLPPQDPATPETAQTGEHLEGYSLSLGETVTIYFYVTLPEDTPQDAAMQFTLPDSTVTQVAVADAKQVEVNGKSCTAFPCQVAAKQLTDDIEARMVVNGKYGPVYTYTVKDYLNYLLEHDYPQQAKELAGTLLVYGGKAQLYFGYRTDALAGTAEPNSTANWGSYQFESSGTQTDDYYGSSLLLEPVIQIRHYFMVPDGAECTFTFAWNAGEPETELQPVDTNTRFDGKKVYYVVTPAIAFRRADAMPVVAMRQNGANLCTLRYGVFSYGDMVRALDDLTTAAQRYSVAG